MNYPIIRLSSVTYAIRAQKQLERHGIQSYIRRLAGNFSGQGCGYALEIRGDINKAAELLRSADIRIVSIDGGDNA